MPSPELQAILDGLRAAPPRVPTDVHGARATIDEMMGGAPAAEGTVVEPVTVAARDAAWVRAPGSDVSRRVVLYLHGGAFRIGSIRAYTPFASHLSAALATPLLVVDYRLAPEHPFPAGLEDCVAGYAWLLAGGVDARDVVIVGDSAGGGLVVSTLLAIRERGLPQPLTGVALSPLADLTRTADSYRRNATTDPYFALEGATEAVHDYLGDRDPRRPLASPVFADLSGLAPLLLHASTDEVLTDDAVALAAQVARCRGRVRLDLWPGTTHVWHAMTPHVPEARDAVRDIASWIDQVAAGRG